MSIVTMAGRVSMSVNQGIGMFRGLAVLGGLCLALSSCSSSPTYGTGTSAMEQLANDVGSAVSVTGGQPAKLNYAARPGLVVPANARSAQLAQPQQSVAGRDNNSAWLESPEEVRERLRAEADANADNPRYRSPLLAGNGTNGQLTETQKWEAFRKAKAEAQGGNVVGSQQRRFLTDPPVEYRSAPAEELADLGEPESKKERQRKKNAAQAGSGTKWWNPFK
jgi:hypothetical protein